MAKSADAPQGKSEKHRAETLEETAVEWALKHPESVQHAIQTLGVLLEGLRHDDCFMDRPEAVGRGMEGKLSNLELVAFRGRFTEALVGLYQFSRAVHSHCPHLSGLARRAAEETTAETTAPALSALPSPFTAADLTGFLRSSDTPSTLEELKNRIDEFLDPYNIRRFTSTTRGEISQPSTDTVIRVYKFDDRQYALHCFYKKRSPAIIIYQRVSASQPWAIEAQWT